MNAMQTQNVNINGPQNIALYGAVLRILEFPLIMVAIRDIASAVPVSTFSARAVPPTPAPLLVRHIGDLRNANGIAFSYLVPVAATHAAKQILKRT